MPVLPNARHEKFAQALASGKSADEAYVNAGYKKSRANASTLKAKQNVADRIAEIKERAASGLQITQQWLIERAEEARQAAMLDHQHSAAVAAIKEIGILSGKRIERSQNTNTVYNISDEPVSEEQWEADHAETAH